MRMIAALFIAFISPDIIYAQVRVKDITDVAGAHPNQLFGFGLVVGLDGTGSRSTFTQQVAVEMLQRLGTTTQIFSQLPAESVIRSTSISAVMVTAELSPYSRKGSRIDVTVSAIDDTRSLQGGILILTPLRGVDGEVYAIAQGPVSVGGFSIAGQAASVQKNHLNVGRIPAGGIVEKEALGDIIKHGKLTLLLKTPDFNTARNICNVINKKYPACSIPIDAGAVTIFIPRNRLNEPINFIAEIGQLTISPDNAAKVVINERTGTVVAGEHVTISPVAISHGNLYLGISERPIISQPTSFATGQTAIVPRTQIGAVEQQARFVALPPTTTVGDVARALNALGVSPRDIIAIFQALKQAGALHAEIIVM
ncbi:MAG: flagellar basal body P-ring protein FlgI [Thermogemmata sp.]|uniref:Flagellar P-ring protein n=1 Tax=Thermogemmata fonticola TaxID=2755323 RepID=A0A7V8VET8_9BACT|nr:flagellar basal body P-ring protein FlgI [Thermogemmata fonticola]MBA2226570.1 flagellar basal body P-ring protein FlgI [Thermogemmata fonticola]MCX8140866.1 flagellar basal body P-ring protein FlgI [Gemmataceae bacterium]GIW85085.1 MAG: flagellar P-ring protein [Gemmataceae bacterium]